MGDGDVTLERSFGEARALKPKLKLNTTHKYMGNRRSNISQTLAS